MNSLFWRDANSVLFFIALILSSLKYTWSKSSLLLITHIVNTKGPFLTLQLIHFKSEPSLAKALKRCSEHMANDLLLSSALEWKGLNIAYHFTSLLNEVHFSSYVQLGQRPFHIYSLQSQWSVSNSMHPPQLNEPALPSLALPWFQGHHFHLLLVIRRDVMGS